MSENVQSGAAKDQQVTRSVKNGPTWLEYSQEDVFGAQWCQK